MLNGMRGGNEPNKIKKDLRMPPVIRLIFFYGNI
jgi:hypothetical protein